MFVKSSKYFIIWKSFGGTWDWKASWLTLVALGVTGIVWQYMEDFFWKVFLDNIVYDSPRLKRIQFLANDILHQGCVWPLCTFSYSKVYMSKIGRQHYHLHILKAPDYNTPTPSHNLITINTDAIVSEKSN